MHLQMSPHEIRYIYKAISPCVSSTLPPRTPTTFPAAAAVLGTGVVASVLVIAAWAAFVFELVEVPFITAFELVFKLAFARNFSFASCSIAISFS